MIWSPSKITIINGGEKKKGSILGRSMSEWCACSL